MSNQQRQLSDRHSIETNDGWDQSMETQVTDKQSKTTKQTKVLDLKELLLSFDRHLLTCLTANPPDARDKNNNNCTVAKEKPQLVKQSLRTQE